MIEPSNNSFDKLLHLLDAIYLISWLGNILIKPFGNLRLMPFNSFYSVFAYLLLLSLTGQYIVKKFFINSRVYTIYKYFYPFKMILIFTILIYFLWDIYLSKSNFEIRLHSAISLLLLFIIYFLFQRVIKQKRMILEQEKTINDLLPYQEKFDRHIESIGD
ncbi:MAG: hypothetical protein ACYC49_03890 [Ignavibacteriaceae bacterium]